VATKTIGHGGPWLQQCGPQPKTGAQPGVYSSPFPIFHLTIAVDWPENIAMKGELTLEKATDKQSAQFFLQDVVFDVVGVVGRDTRWYQRKWRDVRSGVGKASARPWPDLESADGAEVAHQWAGVTAGEYAARVLQESGAERQTAVRPSWGGVT